MTYANLISTYQSHLASNLRKKHNNINQQLDTVIAQANLQIKKLQDALSGSPFLSVIV